MVRLADLKERMNPLSKTKTRLNQSFVDLHDLSRKNTVLDKLKRRFSQSDRDLSKLVAMDISKDFAAKPQTCDDGFVLYNVTSSFNEDRTADCNGEARSKPLRRNSATFDGFSDIMDIIQGKALTDAAEERKTGDNCVIDCDNGLIIANGTQVNGDFSNRLFTDYDPLLDNEELAFAGNSNGDIHGSNGRPDAYFQKIFNRWGAEQGIAKSSKLGGSPELTVHLPKIVKSENKHLICGENVQVCETLGRQGLPEQRYESSYQIVDKVCSQGKTSIVKSPKQVNGDLNNVVQALCETQTTDYQNGSSGANLPTESSPLQQNSVRNLQMGFSDCSASSGACCVASEAQCLTNDNQCEQKRGGGLEDDGISNKTPCSNEEQIPEFNEKLTISYHRDQCNCHKEIKRADVGISLKTEYQNCYARRCTPVIPKCKAVCFHQRLLKKEENLEMESVIGEANDADKIIPSLDDPGQVPELENGSPLATNKDVIECRERSLSEENIMEQNSKPREGRTRRLHSAPSICPMSSEEKARLERMYETNQLKGRSKSLKSAIKKRSTDHNGNVLRVRFDLSKSDEDLRKLRLDRKMLDSTCEKASDLRASATESTEKNEQPKNWRYVIKKFRIKQTLVDVGVTNNTNGKFTDDKEPKCATDSVSQCTKKEPEISLESVKEFSLLLPAKGTQKSQMTKKRCTNRNSVLDVSSEHPSRYVELILLHENLVFSEDLHKFISQ